MPWLERPTSRARSCAIAPSGSDTAPARARSPPRPRPPPARGGAKPAQRAAHRRRAPERQHDQQAALDRQGRERDPALAVAKVGAAIDLGLGEVGLLGDRGGIDDPPARAHQPNRPLGHDHGRDRHCADPHRRAAPRERPVRGECVAATHLYDSRLSARRRDRRHPRQPPGTRGGPAGDRQGRRGGDLVPWRRGRLRSRAGPLRGDRQGALRHLPGRKPRPGRARRPRRLGILSAAAAAVTWTQENWQPPTSEFLKRLQPAGEREDVGLFHASPRDPVWEYVLSIEQATDCMRLQDQRVR